MSKEFSDDFLRGFMSSHMTFYLKLGKQVNGRGDNEFRICPSIYICSNKAYKDVIEYIHKKFKLTSKIYRESTTPQINFNYRNIKMILDFMEVPEMCDRVRYKINIFREIMDRMSKSEDRKDLNLIIDLIKFRALLNPDKFRQYTKLKDKEIIMTYIEVYGVGKFSLQLSSLSKENLEFISEILGSLDEYSVDENKGIDYLE